MAANRVKLTICGANYVIVSEDEESYVQELGTRLDEEMNELMTKNQAISVTGAAVLKALDYLDDNKVVIFGGGTGSPFFSTDTTAALRAAEMNAEVILLAKSIDAVYSEDPNVNPDAERYEELTYMDIVEKELRVMDLTAATLCKDNDIQLYVFAMAEEGNLMKVINGENVGTLIH